MKTCRTCSRTLRLDKFYKHAAMSDGHLNICIDCTKVRVQNHRTLNLEKIREYDRARGRTTHRLAKNREYGRAHKDTTKRAAKRWNIKNRAKTRAQLRLRRAILAGLVTREKCILCGKTPAEGHHYNYSKPLQVVWLCRQHHARIHRKYRDLKEQD